MAASYRFRPGARAPAKDEDGQYMCEFSPYSHTVSPLLDFAKPGKKASIPDTAVIGQIGGAESCGSVALADAGWAVLQQHDMIADAGSVMEAEAAVPEPKARTRSVIDPERNPLQEANRDISAHPVRVSNTQGSSFTGPGKVSASQHESTAAFKEKHLRQMRAANERLERTKVRSASGATSENSDACALRTTGTSPQKRSSLKKQVVQTHVNVSELVTEHHKRESRAKPSTEALLRAASLGQNDKSMHASSRVPRSTSVGQAKPASEASNKTVYATLQSPNLQSAVKPGVKTVRPKVDDQQPGKERQQTVDQLPIVPKQPATVAAEPSGATASKRDEAMQSTDSTRQSKEIPKSVAALANRFEAKAGPGSSRAGRKQSAPARPQTNPTPRDHSATQPSALPKGPSSIVRTKSCENKGVPAVTQDGPAADGLPDAHGNAPSGCSRAHPIPQDPRLHRKDVASTVSKLKRPSVPTARSPAPSRGPESQHASVPQQRVHTPDGLHLTVAMDGPPVTTSAPRHAAAFGSPMPPHVDVCENQPDVSPARNSMLSASCTVNMASPTRADSEAVSAWKLPIAEESERTGGQKVTEHARVQRPPRGVRERPGPDSSEQPVTGTHAAPGRAKDPRSKKSSAAHVAAASPPTRAALARLSDACTSPVDSLWRPLRKALVPHGGHEDDALTTNLLAPDGSPALPAPQFASNSPQKKTARPSTAHAHTARPTSAGSTKVRPATAGPSRKSPSRRPMNDSQPGVSMSESGSDHPSGPLNMGPDRLYSAGSFAKHGLEPALSRGALEMSAAHLRGSVVNDEPFVDFMGVHVDSTYLKSGRSGASKGSCCSIM